MSVRLEAGAASVHWGYLDATLAPVAAIDSGEVVTISTVSGPPEVLEGGTPFDKVEHLAERHDDAVVEVGIERHGDDMGRRLRHRPDKRVHVMLEKRYLQPQR
jgi:hypothetical protein